MNHLKRKNYISGFTLLETVVALAVLLAAVVGPVSLITKGIVNFSFSKNKLIAANLAQEGIETIREIRENNIACSVLGENVKWDDDPSGGKLKGKYTTDANDFISKSCQGQSIKFPKVGGFCDTTKIRLNNGVYTHLGGQETEFTRCVTVCVPPNSSPCNSSADSAIPANDQMEIISEVKWNERGNDKNILLRERLYNWR